MKLIVALAAFFVIASPAQAKPGVDPRFSWSKAKAAYASAQVPAAQDYLGDWKYAGYAYPKDSAYHPDGKMFSGMTEFYWLTRISDSGLGQLSVIDLILTLQDNHESGLTDPNRAVWSRESGVRYQSSKSNQRGSDVVCETFEECKISNDSSSLICAAIVTKGRSCVEVYGRLPVRYSIFLRR